MQHRLARLALIVALAGAAGVGAQSRVAGWDPRSGDAWVDAQLADINRYGARYRDPFIDEMTRYYGAPRALVEDLLRRGWAPGDVYFACALAQAAARPCRHVVQAWEQDHARGWGAIAQRVGIRPGSAEFHQLKRGFVPTFARWGRPIQPDASLADDFAGRSVEHRVDGAPTQGRGDHRIDRVDDSDNSNAESDRPGGLPPPGLTPAHGRGPGRGRGHGHG